MAKLERGCLNGLSGTNKFSVEELFQSAARLEAQVNDPQNTDDPKWLKRWADKLCRLAGKKEKAREHKERQN